MLAGPGHLVLVRSLWPMNASTALPAGCLGPRGRSCNCGRVAGLAVPLPGPANPRARAHLRSTNPYNASADAARDRRPQGVFELALFRDRPRGP